VSGEHA